MKTVSSQLTYKAIQRWLDSGRWPHVYRIKSKKLGSGGNATVYQLSHGESSIVCKVSNLTAECGELDTEAELSALLATDNPHILHITKYIGKIRVGDRRLLIFDYVPMYKSRPTALAFINAGVGCNRAGKRRWKREVRIMFFQLLFTLAQLHEKYPGFRHNDLSPNNVVLVQPVTRTYRMGNRTWRVDADAARFSVHIIDFALAHGTGLHNCHVEENLYDQVGIVPQPHPTYDMHLFFYMFQRMSDLPDSVRNFIYRCVPVALYSVEHITSLDNCYPRLTLEAQDATRPLPPPRVLLCDSFFDALRVHDEDVVSSSSSSPPAPVSPECHPVSPLSLPLQPPPPPPTVDSQSCS